MTTTLSEVRTKTDYGIIVGRFQIPEIHTGHIGLIDSVLSRDKKVAIFLGVSRGSPIAKDGPLDYHTRYLMIQEAYPDIAVSPITDLPSDKQWSEILDEKVQELCGVGTATLYGSRDGFIPHYHGKLPTIELAATQNISGSVVRKMVSEEVRRSIDFRRGVIYAAHNRFDISYQTVDIAICREQEILLCRKKIDLEGEWRLVGGFVDPSDESLETTAKREVQEETGVSISEIEYLGSARINDHRYQGSDKILTALFLATYQFGAAVGADDINEVKWFDIEESPKFIMPDHAHLIEMVLNHRKGRVIL